MRVALYLRRSKLKQEASIDAQRADLHRFCSYKGYTIVAEYSDTMSGAIDKRPSLSKLLQDAERGTFTRVCAWRLDRFGRSIVNILNNISVLTKAGVSFETVQEGPLDPSTPMGTMLLGVLSTFAQVERANISERTKMGLRLARERGKVLGAHFRKGPPRQGHFTSNKKIAELRHIGLSYRQIAERLGCSASHVCNVLRRKYG